MKKLSLILSFILIANFIISQNQIRTIEEGKTDPLNKLNRSFNSKTPTDTLNLNAFFNAGQPLMGELNGMHGWMFGTSWWGIDTMASKACAQGFIVPTGISYMVEEVLIWAHTKYADTITGSSLIVTINSIDSTSTYTGNPNTYNINCPGTVLDTAIIPYSSIDTSFNLTFTKAIFSPSILVLSDFAVVVDFSNFYLNHDTVGFVSGTTGSASNIMGLAYTWWMYHNSISGIDFWAQLSHIFVSSGTPTDKAIAIWPVVDAGFGTSKAIHFIEGLKMNQNRPNPVADYTIIDYVLEKNSQDVKLAIYDSNGKVIFESKQGSKNIGQYSIRVNTDNFASGKYYYSLTADGNRLTKKMIITK